MLRKIALAILLVAWLSLGNSVLAQGNSTFCGSLSSADCTLLNHSGQTMAKVEAVAFHVDVRMDLGGINTLFSAPISFRLVGDGTYRINGEQIAKLNADAQKGKTKFPELIEGVFRNLGFDANLIIELPEAVTSTLSTRRQHFPERLPLEIRMVDGFAYVNTDKLAALLPDVRGVNGWYGLDIAGYYREFFRREPNFNFTPLPGDATSGALQTLEKDFMEVARLENGELAGQQLAVFQTTFDMGKLLRNPLFREALKAGIRQGMGGSALGMESRLDAVTQLFETVTLNWSESVGLQDNYLHHFDLHFGWQPDASAARNLDMSELALWKLLFDVNLDLGRFNDVPEVTAPKGATIIPLDSLLPYLPSNGLQT
jgi:hypothetical protein